MGAAPVQTPNGMTDPNLPSFICSVAALIRGGYKQSEYGKVVQPVTAGHIASPGGPCEVDP